MMYDFFSFVQLSPEEIRPESILHWKYLVFLGSSPSPQHCISIEYMASCPLLMPSPLVKAIHKRVTEIRLDRDMELQYINFLQRQEGI